MEPIDFSSIPALKDAGFTGFQTIDLLRLNNSLIPDSPGVYIIVRDKTSKPVFTPTGTGGFFKGRDPNVPIAILEANWVDGTPVVYIGKAGGGDSKATLRTRLKQYFQFGQGQAVGHYGGRYIWQLADAFQLKVGVFPCTNPDPRVIESLLIMNFTTQYGKRPFANLTN